MAWYRRLIGKKVTINGGQGVSYHGRLIGCLNGRVILKDVYVYQGEKCARLPLLALDIRRVGCLHLCEGEETISINLRAVG